MGKIERVLWIHCGLHDGALDPGGRRDWPKTGVNLEPNEARGLPIQSCLPCRGQRRQSLKSKRQVSVGGGGADRLKTQQRRAHAFPGLCPGPSMPFCPSVHWYSPVPPSGCWPPPSRSRIGFPSTSSQNALGTRLFILHSSSFFSFLLLDTFFSQCAFVPGLVPASDSEPRRPQTGP